MVPNDDGNGAAQLAVTELKLRSNLIRGTLPADFGLLSSMVAVDFSDNNNVQGSLPSSLASWSNLTSLSTLNTGLSGVLSDSLADAWSNLQTFSVGGLDGTIPSSLSRWVKAKHMDFVGSKMVGTLPEALLQLTNLEYFRITSSNNAGLNGTIPAGVGSWTNMKTLIVHGQRFAGSIPDALQQLTNMQVFQMSGNAFLNGTFPEWIGPAWNKNLTSLRLSGSRLLKGQLPASIGMLTKLTSLDVNGNAFSGTFPASLWNLTNVTVAYLSGNMFNDTVPSTFCQKGRTIFVDRNKVNCTCCI
jgi:Leucine-rich repeat (LRR) protein